MEDISRQAGISKKTIYQEFKDKKELITTVFVRILEEEKKKMEFLAGNEDGVIEHLLQTSKMMRERMGSINPMAIYEVQRYFPEAWEQFELFKEEYILKDIIQVLERGKTLGYFRPEIDSHILARLRVNQVSSAFELDKFEDKNYNMLEAQMEMMDHFLHGIFTEKGRLAYQNQKAIQEKN